MEGPTRRTWMPGLSRIMRLADRAHRAGPVDKSQKPPAVRERKTAQPRMTRLMARYSKEEAELRGILNMLTNWQRSQYSREIAKRKMGIGSGTAHLKLARKCIEMERRA